jgi:heptosyltransferase II
VIPYHVGKGIRSLSDQTEIARQVHIRGFELAVLFPNSFASALWVAMAGVPRRVGYIADGRSFLLTDRMRRPEASMNGHQSGDWLALVQSILEPPDGFQDGIGLDQPLEVSPKHRDKICDWLSRLRQQPKAPLIAIAPAAAYGPAKEWPPAHYAKLIDLLNRHYGAECVLVGGADERSRCAAISQSSSTQAIIAAGATSVGELIALLSLCSGFVGNDSGAMHLAAAIGIPTVGIFGSTNPSRTGPRGPRATVIYRHLTCSPCLTRTCRYGHYDCLQKIEPFEVITALERLGAFATN